jgi:nitrile hydratase accessory protein
MSGSQYEQRRRNLVTRTSDERPVNVARFRGQLFVCYENCCCGRTEDGFAPVPVDVYQSEWERRRLRNFVHLTIGGCLGPCALANVALLLFDGRAAWFQSMNSPVRVYELYDYIEAMLEADGYLPPPPALAALQFTASAWEERPDGAPLDDARPWRPRAEARASGVASNGAHCVTPAEEGREQLVAGLGASNGDPASVPRRNGELVFDEAWEARAFGMAIATHEGALFDWEEFRQQLIATIGEADAREEDSGYYERWVAAFETLLAERGVVAPVELDERTYEFEYGERDEVF